MASLNKISSVSMSS